MFRPRFCGHRVDGNSRCRRRASLRGRCLMPVAFAEPRALILVLECQERLAQLFHRVKRPWPGRRPGTPHASGRALPRDPGSRARPSRATPAPTRLLRDLLTQMSERIDGPPYRSPWGSLIAAPALAPSVA
jgi:hypothetical protein